MEMSNHWDSCLHYFIWFWNRCFFWLGIDKQTVLLASTVVAPYKPVESEKEFK